MPILQTFEGVYLWHYVPSLPAAATFAALFALLTTIHIWKMVTTKTWLSIPFVIGGAFEVIGYAARAACYDATGSLPPYLIQSIFLVLPPVFFAASLYMVYSHVVRAVRGQAFSLMSPRRTTIYFVIADWTCLSVQSDGSGLLVHQDLARIGEYIIVGGLILQVLLFVFFITCCWIFHRRFRKHLDATGASCDVPWQSSLNMLYSASGIILARNLYRVVEFITGQDGYLLSNEWPLYTFDGALMLVVMVGFFIWYPTNLQLRPESSTMELTAVGADTEASDQTGKVP